MAEDWRATEEQRALVRAGVDLLDRYRCAECDEYRWQPPVGDFPTCAAGHEMRFDGRLGDGRYGGWPAFPGLARVAALLAAGGVEVAGCQAEPGPEHRTGPRVLIDLRSPAGRSRQTVTRSLFEEAPELLAANLGRLHDRWLEPEA